MKVPFFWGWFLDPGTWNLKGAQGHRWGSQVNQTRSRQELRGWNGERRSLTVSLSLSLSLSLAVESPDGTSADFNDPGDDVDRLKTGQEPDALDT